MTGPVDAAPRSGVASLVVRVSFWLTMAYVASVPIENARTVSSHSLAKLIGALALVSALLAASAQRRLRVAPGVLAAMFLFVSWVGCSYFWTADTAATTRYLVTAIQLVAITVVIWQSVVDRRTLHIAFAAAIVGSCIGSALSLKSQISKHGGVARYAVGDPNDFGVMLAVTATLTLYLVLDGGYRTRTRILLVLALALQAVAIARTGSRTALLAAVAGLAAMLFLRRPRLTLAGLLTGVAAAGLALVGVSHFVAKSTISRAGGALSSAESGDLNHRTTYWARAMSLWGDHPFNGVGAGAFRDFNTALGHDAVAHSTFFGVLAELGVIGLGLFLAMIVTAGRTVRFGDRRLWFATFVAWLGAGVTLTFEVRKMTWLLLALASALAATRVYRAGGAPAAESPSHEGSAIPASVR